MTAIEPAPLTARGWTALERADQDRANYAARKAAYEAGLAKVKTWEWERMVLPPGTSRRTRQKVTVKYNPDGWRRHQAGGHGTEICASLMQFDAYPHPPGKTGRQQWDEDHGRILIPPYGDVEHTTPTVWKVCTTQKSRYSGRGGGTWCDRCLPAEFRPQADGSPPPEFGPLAGQEPRRKQERREGPRDLARYAIPDPLDPAKVSYWYRPDRGREKGNLQPWPPQRNTWGKRLYRKDLPVPGEPVSSPANRVFAAAFWDRVREAHKAAVAEIDTNPELAAARFARYSVSCCACGKAMWDERSVAYGIGPECRRGASPEFLSRMIEVTKQAFAEDGLVQAAQPTDRRTA